MEFLTAKEVAEILKTSEHFVYKHYEMFGGVKLGRILRFEKSIFEEVMHGVLSSSREVSVRLLEERRSTPESGIRNQTRSENGRSRSKKESQKDKYGFHKTLREQAG